MESKIEKSIVSSVGREERDTDPREKLVRKGEGGLVRDRDVCIL